MWLTFGRNSAKFWQIMQNFVKISRIFSDFNKKFEIREQISWNFVEGLCISGNPNKGNSVIRCYQQTRPNGTLVVSSYSTYIRRLVTRPFFRSRARVALGSELRLLMSFSWPVFPGLDQVLFPPWFSSFLGFKTAAHGRTI